MLKTVFFHFPTRFSKALNLPEGIGNYWWYTEPQETRTSSKQTSNSGENTTKCELWREMGKKIKSERERRELELAFMFVSFHLL